jgi:DNA repair protein RadC
MIAHTHPSGNLKPSTANINMMHKLKVAAKLMDIRLLDHLIITTESYYNFADEGQI